MKYHIAANANANANANATTIDSMAQLSTR
ncbi:hypothetical protein RHDC4_02332 [Rhodocyclaceae bacterium]|nr:hypothetical protein RHDC4_02332 [Rhodocyclaceae bacterium]